MKIAVLFTGFTRTYQACYSSVKQSLLDKYDCDIYYSTWDKQENGELTNANKLNELYTPKGYIIEQTLPSNIFQRTKNPDIFDINSRAKEHGVYWADRLMRQWKLINSGFKILQKKEYNIVVRLRFDLILNHITICDKDYIYVPKDLGGWDFTDHMAYGSYKNMKIYSNLFNSIKELYELDIDITHAVDMPHKYLTMNNVNIMVDPTGINYRLNK
jgi:hypothetical protein